ncbi:putative ankyrin repeat protein RF_0381 [Lineus longissimus]|uniref:putative ankyrin repeat protein RF_0381 n=1 Tax=Lineus longissimus TaxID=88925 RepID=UPI002B4D476A
MESFFKVIQEGSLTEVEKEFKNVVNVDTVCHGETALLQTIRRQDFRFIEFILNNGASVTKQPGTDISPLNLAVESRTRNLEIIELLLLHGADVFEEDDYGDTILMNAVFRRDYEVVMLFLNSVSGEGHGESCLAASCCIVSRVHIEEILKRGVSPNNSEMSPLIFSCLLGDEAMVSMLLDYGADVNIEDPRGGTPLSNAISAGNQSNLIKLLVTHGADVNHMTTGFDDPGVEVTPLMEAARMRDLPNIRELLRLGADVNIKNNQRRTALHYCSGWETYCPVIKSSLKRVTLAGGIYGTNRSTYRIVKTLVDYGADVSIKDSDDRTPLDVNLKTLHSMFVQTEGRLKASTKLLPIYLSICCSLLKASAASCENSREVFNSFLDAFLSCDHLDDIPSAERLVDIVNLAFMCGLNLSVGNKRPTVELKHHVTRRNVFDFVAHLSRNCLTLKQLCRIQLRKNTRRTQTSVRDMHDIPLPTLLKEYLLYENDSLFRPGQLILQNSPST